VQIASGTIFKAVAAGTDHSLAIDNNGNLWVWGNNEYGQLGDGTSGYVNNKSSPMQIKVGTTFKAVAGGYSHSLAIDELGNLWAWGRNGSGQLGDGTTVSKYSPVQIKNETTFKEIAGYNHSLAIDNNGNLWVWGNNGYGQLGDETTTNKSSPVQIKDETIFKVIAGYNHSLAIDQSGNLWAWGRNDYGQLGDGTGWRETPIKIFP
jgi:alpha-tubulin suppressor-like RCC1 family protein